MDASRPGDSGAATNWATAKKTIQAAVDLAEAGDTVLVTNGVYDRGGTVAPGYALTNRIYISTPIAVRSLNGPYVTFIEGAPGSNGSNDVDSVRGVCMTNGCTLIGFTVTNGYTMNDGDAWMDSSAAGVMLFTNCTVSNCLIVGNTARNSAGVLGCAGVLYDSTISGNTAHNYYGGAAGGGSMDEPVTLNRCTLSQNTAAYCGGVNNGVLNNCIVNENQGSQTAGGVVSSTLNNCLVVGNSGKIGGGVNSCTINNCTIYGNTAENGGGMYSGRAKNCIFWGNTASVSDDNIHQPLSVEYSCSPDGVSEGGSGCTTNNPLFQDAVNSNYSLQVGSPCINTGNNAYAPTNVTPVDLAGNPRVLFGTVDMGAYERVSLISAESGPSAGGNTIMVTNGVALGNGTDITNVTVCGVAATIVGQGANWVSVMLGAGLAGGTTGDVSIQSTSEGTTTISNVYTYNPMGLISRVTPSIGSVTGGYPVVISGSNLGSGSDVSAVTLCGVSVQSMVSQSATQVVVRARAGFRGVGPVVIQSTGYGTITLVNGFTYRDPVFLDFDGDGKADIVTYYPAAGMWSILQSSLNTGRYQAWGWRDAIPVPGDYDGDSLFDVAVYAPQTGTWLIWQSATQTKRAQSWGWNESIPVPGDYDGDERCDLAVYVPASGVWHIWQSATQTERTQSWGWSGAMPVPGDYDGDGLTDVAVYAPASGTWHIWQSATQSARIQSWGGAEAEPIPGDYDGDGLTDVAVYWPESGMWYAWLSATQTGMTASWGWNAAWPVPADYDGDGIFDRTVYAPELGRWYLWQTGSNTQRIQPWGFEQAEPVN